MSAARVFVTGATPVAVPFPVVRVDLCFPDCTVLKKLKQESGLEFAFLLRTGSSLVGYVLFELKNECADND